MAPFRDVDRRGNVANHPGVARVTKIRHAAPTTLLVRPFNAETKHRDTPLRYRLTNIGKGAAAPKALLQQDKSMIVVDPLIGVKVNMGLSKAGRIEQAKKKQEALAIKEAKRLTEDVARRSAYVQGGLHSELGASLVVHRAIERIHVKIKSLNNEIAETLNKRAPLDDDSHDSGLDIKQKTLKQKKSMILCWEQLNKQIWEHQVRPELGHVNNYEKHFKRFIDNGRVPHFRCTLIPLPTRKRVIIETENGDLDKSWVCDEPVIQMAKDEDFEHNIGRDIDNNHIPSPGSTLLPRA